MGPQNDDRKLFTRIYMLEAEAEKQLSHPQNSITVATYALGFAQDKQRYLFFENKTASNAASPSSCDSETTVSLQHRNNGLTTSVRSTIKGAGSDETLSGFVSPALWCLANPEVSTFSEHRALFAVRSLWRALGAQPWKENTFHCELQTHPFMARLSRKVVDDALPLIAKGALFLHQSTELSTSGGELYLEKNQLSGDPRHTDSRFTGWPLLRLRFRSDGTDYVYERTARGEEETQEYPADRETRYKKFYDYTPQMTDEGLIPYPVLRQDIERFEAMERKEGKYTPQQRIVDLILANLQSAAAQQH